MISLRKFDLFEDAVFYRDVTHWLRQKRMHLLLPGLMTLGLISVLAPGMFSSLAVEGNVGIVSLVMLAMGYCLYGLLILGNTGNSIKQEFTTNTYELYEAAGLKPEDMLRGHMLSMVAFLLIGLAALMPYGVVSWMLGGVDFTLLLFLLVLVLAFIPFATVLIVTSAYSMCKSDKNLERQVPGGALIVLGLLSLPGLISGLSRLPGMNPVGYIINVFLKSPVFFILSTLLGMAMYAGLLLLSFYHGSHKLCRFWDTRMYQVQVCVVFIAATWGLFWGLTVPWYTGGLTLSLAIFAYLPLGIIIFGLLFATLTGRMHPPQAFAFRYRYKDGVFNGCPGLSSWRLILQRWSLNRFGPSELTARTQVCFLLGYSAVLLALGFVLNTSLSFSGMGKADNLRLFHLVDIFSLMCLYCLFVPLFPSGLLQDPKSPLFKPRYRMVIVVLTWFFLAVMLSVGWMFFVDGYISEKSHSAVYYFVVEFTALFFPSSAEDFDLERLFSPYVSTLIRFGLGILGYFMLSNWLKKDVIRDTLEKTPPVIPSGANKTETAYS